MSPGEAPKAGSSARSPDASGRPTCTYYDTSALVKLVVVEPESGALRTHWLSRPRPVSSALARTELMRALGDVPGETKAQARALLAALEQVALDDQLLDSAANLGPDVLRTLGAIHLASALSLGDSLAEVVTYDQRMAGAARNLGLAVAAPSAAGPDPAAVLPHT
ncbi:MAG: type II toxin-antitoxin system VapC family toxin [Bifidobacteriaceae bacterium]|nr:type II toxin-antitoxin system VapC family toxin [Bifidobacteriaceae bacterium]